MSSRIDTRYRPKSYFGPRSLEDHTLGKVKGAAAREMLTGHPELGGPEILERMVSGEISPQVLASLGNVHPMFLGGNFLPDATDGEIEIARIEIASTTGDVTALLARAERGKIRYRIVDEYEGETLNSPTRKTSDKPLSLGEMANFFLAAWSLVDVLRMNFDEDLESALGFFTAKSAFYPDFDDLCRWRAVKEYCGAAVGRNPRALSREEIGLFILKSNYAEFTSWLEYQSEDSLAELREQLPIPVDEALVEAMEDIQANASQLELSQDLLTLCAHYDISPPKLTVLGERLHEDFARQERLLEEASPKKKKPEQAVAPRRKKFEREIALMLSELNDNPIHGGGISGPSLRWRVGNFLHQYVGSHGRLPEGPHKIHVFFGPVVDFDALRRKYGL